MMLLLAVVGCSIYANAQIEKGDSMITLALGVSPTFYSGNGFEASLPPIEAAYEYAISDNITVGGFAGIATAEFRSAGFGYDYTYILAGGLGNYHFVNSETFDVYVGAKLGYVNVSSKEVGAAFGINAESSGILFGGQLGARYWITETIAINAEAGYGVAALRLGVSFSI
ncbi:MAG: outer membrane beta-barrel protein [Dokdonia sp.]